MKIYTIGHSNRSFADFADLLDEYGIEVLADVRRYPGSRKFPHFNREAMADALVERSIEYRWIEELGGRRHGDPDQESPNKAIESAGFRNYADHMLTDEFRETVEALLETAREKRLAVMCAEKLFWRCHRRLLSDYLTAQGAEVFHIMDLDNFQPHKLSREAVVTDERKVIYPPEEA